MMIKQFAMLAGVMSLMALSACGPRQDDTRLARSEEGTAPAQQASASEAAASDAPVTQRDTSMQVAGDLRDSAKNAADQATNKVADAVITTSINAELAKDPALSAAQIEVDTEGGRVALKGTVPDESARERAAQLAGSVDGVVSVENQLTVQGRS